MRKGANTALKPTRAVDVVADGKRGRACGAAYRNVSGNRLAPSI